MNLVLYMNEVLLLILPSLPGGFVCVYRYWVLFERLCGVEKYSVKTARSHNVVYVRKVDRKIMTFCQYLHSEQRQKHQSATGLFVMP